ncbi:MAG: hypothetical protein ACRBK7_25005 [Acidimicrobiales bacterium]
MNESTSAQTRDAEVSRFEPLASLADPRFLVALVVLIVNDQWLKAAYGSWLTGKLSDVAGLVVFPTIVGVVVSMAARRRQGPQLLTLALGLSGLWFAAMKTTPLVAQVTERLFETLTARPSTIVVDPTDLIGLVGLAIAWPVLNDARPLIDAKFVRAVLLGTGLIACLATSNSEPELYNLLVDTSSDEVASGASYDGKEPFSTISLLPDQTRLSADQAKRFTNVDETAGCISDADGELCFRIDGDRVQQRSADGSGWVTVWRLERVKPSLDKLGAGANYDPNLEIRELAVSGDGHLYVVVDGLWSLLTRSPDGSWSPEASLFRGFSPFLSLFTALAVLLAMVLVGSYRVVRWPMIIGLFGLVVAYAVDGAVGTLVGGPLLLFGALFALMYVSAWVAWRRWFIIAAAVVLGALASAIPMLVWSRNLDIDYPDARLATLLVSIVALVAAGLISRRFVVGPGQLRSVEPGIVPSPVALNDSGLMPPPPTVDPKAR